MVALLALLLSACGGNDAGGGGGKPRLTVSAATSLTNAFEEYGRRFDAATARFSFAGSDELAAQIRQGVKPDVYAAANTELPQQLFEAGLVRKPVKFAANRLVIAVAADSDGAAGSPGSGGISSIEDLGKRGVKLAIGAASVPVGEYAREVIGRLPEAEAEAILGNVRSQEPDVAGVLGKLTLGAADAGFLYITDIRAAGDKVRAIELPKDLQPSVDYGVAVVEGAKQPEAAREFVQGLLDGPGFDALQRAGFEPPSK